MIIGSETRQEAIGDTFHAVNKAFQEDEFIKSASQQRSIQYIKDIEDEDEKIPLWWWCLGSFCVGVIFAAGFIHFNWIEPIRTIFI